jgi:hypothetical protein
VYHVGVAAVTASADEKWIDNLLARFDLPGVDRSRQGVARRISLLGLKHIVLIRWLGRELGVPLPTAVSVATRALASADGSVAVAPGVELRIDVARLSAEVDELLADAVESIVPARRGRPPRQRSTTE